MKNKEGNLPANDHGICRLVGRLDHAEKIAKERHETLKHGFRRALDLLRSPDPGKWVDVQDCTRDAGEHHLIRRTYSGVPEETCLAVWLDTGWEVLFGTLNSSRCSWASIEQWVPTPAAKT